MEQYKYWIALDQTQGVGIAAMNEIKTTLDSLSLHISDLYELTEEEITSEFSFSKHIIKGIVESKSKLEEVDNIYCDLMEAEIQTTLFFEDSYPKQLLNKLKNQAPAIIYSIGDLKIANEPGVAILGDSDISSKGEMIDYMAAKILSQHQITTISGMSKGAGVIAHHSAIENSGKTVAILPCGIFNFKMSEKLQADYDEKRFLIISPFYPTTDFSKFNAFNRNRIICALSKAVYIIEAPLEDGVFEAGKSAHKLGIPLFTTKYAEYPEGAKGNIKLVSDYNAYEISGKRDGNTLTPNLDKLIAEVKFSDN